MPRRAAFFNPLGEKYGLDRLTDHFDLIHNLLDALDASDEFLRHLLMEIRGQATSKDKYPLVKLANNCPKRSM
jgi:hypothetical protein